MFEPLMILVAGPYRSGTNDDPALIEAIAKIKAIDNHAHPLRYVAEVDNIDTIKRFVEVGQGVAIVPEPAVQSEVKSETLCAVHFSDEKLSRPLAVVHRKGKQFSLAADRFIEFLMSKKTTDEVEAKNRAG